MSPVFLELRAPGASEALRGVSSPTRRSLRAAALSSQVEQVGMADTPKPHLVTARVAGGEVIISGDGVELMRLSVRKAVWLIARIAEAVAEPRP